MSSSLHATSNYAGLVIAKQITAVIRDPVAAYTAYAARVTADGGTVSDATACQAAFTAAYKGGYWWQVRFAFCARWGIRSQNGFITKMYNLFDPSLDAYFRGDVDLDNSLGYNAPLFNASADTMIVRAVPLNKNNRFGYVVSTNRPTSTIGIPVTYTPVSEPWSIADYDGSGTAGLLVNGVTLNAPGAEYSVPSNAAVGYMVDQANNRIDVWLDGALKKRNLKSFTQLATGLTAEMTWARVAAANVYLNEAWYFDDATFDGVQQCGVDLGIRY